MILWSTLPGTIRCSGIISADIFNLIKGNTKEKYFSTCMGSLDRNVCYILFNIQCVYFYYHDQYHHRHHHINLIVIVSSVIKDTIKCILILLTGQVGGFWDTS